MRAEHIQPGALVYDRQRGRLYRLGEARNAESFIGTRWEPCWFAGTELGRRGEESPSHDFNRAVLLADFDLWCPRCDGTGWMIRPDPGHGLRCDLCEGDGLIH